MNSTCRIPTFCKVLALFVGILVVGCAPPTAQAPVSGGRLAAAKSAGLATSALYGTGSTSNWACPNVASNVTLKDNIGFNGYDYTGNGNFKVCKSKTNGSTFQVSGVTSSNSLCIYPMFASNGNIQLVDTPKCFSVGSTPIEAVFSSASINYMVIVDANYTQQLNSCLSSPASCPPHSEGFVQ